MIGDPWEVWSLKSSAKAVFPVLSDYGSYFAANSSTVARSWSIVVRPLRIFERIKVAARYHLNVRGYSTSHDHSRM